MVRSDVIWWRKTEKVSDTKNSLHVYTLNSAEKFLVFATKLSTE